MLLSRHQTFTLTRIAFLAFALTSQAQAVIFTVNPNAIGVGDSSFTADSLLVSEVSHIQFIDALGDFTEAGYGYVTGADLNGNSVTTTGLGTDYTLYFQFTDQGGGTTLSSGTINFFAVAGTSTFGVSNNVAFVDNNGNTPSPLGNTTMSGTVGGDPSTALTAYATSPAFEFNSSGAVFFWFINDTSL